MPATHTVKAGESLTGIARKYGITTNALYAANGGAARLKNIHPEQKLRLPAPASNAQAQPQQAKAAPAMPATHTVKPGESLTGIARKYSGTPHD